MSPRRGRAAAVGTDRWPVVKSSHLLVRCGRARPLVSESRRLLFCLLCVPLQSSLVLLLDLALPPPPPRSRLCSPERWKTAPHLSPGTESGASRSLPPSPPPPWTPAPQPRGAARPDDPPASHAHAMHERQLQRRRDNLPQPQPHRLRRCTTTCCLACSRSCRCGSWPESYAAAASGERAPRRRRGARGACMSTAA